MLNKIKTVISKGMGYVYVFIKYKFKKKKKVNNKDILIIFGGHLGNAVLGMDLLMEAKKLFPSEKGWKLHIMCNEKLRKICETIGDMSGFDYLDISYPFMDGGTRFKVVRRTLRAMKGMQFDKIIINMAHIMPLAQYIVAAIPANESIGVFDNVEHKADTRSDIEHNFGNLRWYFEKAFTDPVYVDYNTQEVQRQRLILERLGDKDYRVRVYPISKLCEFDLPDGKYITMTIDSAAARKRWEPWKFAEVADHFIEKYGYTVCLTGGADAEGIYNECMENIKNKNSVMNYVGKTNFTQWVELLRGSSFHIGVDSGSIHIASSVGTQSFCMIGAWDGERVLPYRIERAEDNTAEPICVYMKGMKNLGCYACVPKRGLFGSGNERCLSNCRSGKPCYCLEMIKSSDVIDKVEEWLSKTGN